MLLKQVLNKLKKTLSRQANEELTVYKWNMQIRSSFSAIEANGDADQILHGWSHRRVKEDRSLFC